MRRGPTLVILVESGRAASSVVVEEKHHRDHLSTPGFVSTDRQRHQRGTTGRTTTIHCGGPGHGGSKRTVDCRTSFPESNETLPDCHSVCPAPPRQQGRQWRMKQGRAENNIQH